MINKKLKLRQIIYAFLILVFCWSIYNIISWNIDRLNIKKQLNIINDNLIINEAIDSDKTIIVEQEDIIPEYSPYWDYIGINLLNVDFTKLRELNNQTVGWLEVKGTNINYPFVQTKDNTFYLNHSFDKKYNKAGWVFLDYRNDRNSLNKNTVIYAHGRVDTTMFGSLKNIIKNDEWFNNHDNHIIRISTEKENTLWQVISYYSIDETNDYLKIDFSSDTEFKYFADMLIKRSIYDFKTNVNENDKIITLSTCYNNTKRIVMHAKLIKTEKR